MKFPTFLAWLQLVRLPNVVTAAADSLAGWLLVTGTLYGPGRWIWLTTASMVLYAAGTALNDVFDFEVDRAERPKRPLPSGQVSRRTAGWFGALGLLIGPALALASGSLASGAVAVALSLCILSYDAGMKHTRIGPLFMGACRGLNLLLGMSHAPALGGEAAWLVALAYALFVTGITIISRSEVSGGNRRGLVAGVIAQDLALLGLIATAMFPRAFPRPDPGRSIVWFLGLLVLATTGFIVDLSAWRAFATPTPGFIQKHIKTSLLSLIWLHVGIVAAVRGWEPAAIVAAFWLPAFILGRWLYST